MNPIQKRTHNSSSFLEDVVSKYLPYWPLFVLLAAGFLVLAYGYLKITKPVYEITSSLLLNDEKKGADEAQLAETVILPTSKKIVENELEVIRSRKLMDVVVNKLHLYAPLYEKARIKTLSAYSSSPIIIETSDPAHITEVEKVYFNYDAGKKNVIINGKAYPLSQPQTMPYGVISFLPNPRYLPKAEKNKFYFSLYKTKTITTGILSNLEVNAVGKLSSIVKLKIKDESPQRGEDILNNLMQEYSQSTIDFKNQLAKNSLKFIDERLNTVAGELKGVEKQIQGYKSSQGIVNLGDQGRLYLQNVSENDQKVSALNMKMAVLNQVEKYVTKKDNSAGIVPSTLGVEDPMLSKLLDKLYQAETEYDKLKQTAGENNPLAQTLSSQIENIRPGIMENIRSQKSAVSASLGNVGSTNNKYNSVLSTLPQKERELIEVSREQSVKNSAYAFLLQKREQMALAYSSNVPDSKIVDEAEASIRPVSPKKSIAFIIAIAVALGITFLFITVKELFTNKVLFRSEIENYSELPIAGEISRFPGKKSILPQGNSFDQLQNQVKQLRAALGLTSLNTDTRKILVTSSIEGEGKTTVSANLAISLAQSGYKVVLIDFDFRNPGVTKRFEKFNETFVNSYLEGTSSFKEVLHSTEFKNLWIIGAGNYPGNPTDLLLKSKPGVMLEELSLEFDFIVIDTPPVNSEIDAYILSPYCDLSLFVLRHGVTPKSVLKKLDENLTQKILTNPVIVFNGIRPRGFIKRTKHYGYGYQTISS